MTSTLQSLPTLVVAAQTEMDEAQAPQIYRLKKKFAVVRFDLGKKGQIVFLEEGVELRVIGPSCLRGCFEVTDEIELYNIFKVDLLGPWSAPIQPPLSKSNQLKPVRHLAVLGATA